MLDHSTNWRTTLPLARALALAALLAVSAGCSGDDDSPTAPTPQPQLATFMEAGTGFSTNDVRDSERDVVRFDLMGNLIWVPTGAAYGGFPVSGNLIGPTQGFEARFGTENGQKRAYFVERATGTICDIDVINGMLNVSPTTQAVPNT